MRAAHPSRWASRWPGSRDAQWILNAPSYSSTSSGETSCLKSSGFIRMAGGIARPSLSIVRSSLPITSTNASWICGPTTAACRTSAQWPEAVPYSVETDLGLHEVRSDEVRHVLESWQDHLAGRQHRILQAVNDGQPGGGIQGLYRAPANCLPSEGAAYCARLSGALPDQAPWPSRQPRAEPRQFAICHASDFP